MPVNVLATNTWSIQLQNSAYGGRLMVGAFLAPSSSTVTRDGVLVGYSSGAATPRDLQVIPDVAPSAWLQVYPGRAVVTRSGQGPYLHAFDSTVPLRVQLDPADSTNPRIDAVVVRNYDQVTRGVDGQTRGQIEVITGDPAVTPVVPYAKIPAGVGYTPLAEIAVPATTGATQITAGQIVDRRRGTALRGSVRTLLPGDSLTEAGVLVGELTDTGGATGQLRRWNGSSWSRLAQAGPQPYCRGELLRSDGQTVINASGITDLKIYNFSAHGAAWGSVFNGRGISLAEPGIYQIFGKLLGSFPNPHYTALRLTSPSPAFSNVIGADNANSGFFDAEGTEFLYVSAGQTLGVTFEAFSSSSSQGVINANGVSEVHVRKFSEVA